MELGQICQVDHIDIAMVCAWADESFNTLSPYSNTEHNHDHLAYSRCSGSVDRLNDWLGERQSCISKPT